MSEPVIKINIPEWIESARADKSTYHQRQVTEVILHAIAITPSLNNKLYLKGGVLMGLVYGSPRQTSDIDFSVATTESPDENTTDTFKKLLNSALLRTAAKLGYADMVVRIQSVKELPHNRYLNACFPALQLKIAYAERGSHQEERLLEGMAANIIRLDISFNEEMSEIQFLEITDGESLLAYSLIDLIAEKYRAMLEQVHRNRRRRQDVYDLDILILDPELDDEAKAKILITLIKKCQSRGIIPSLNSIDNPEIRSRSGSEWDTLELEIGEIPDFNSCFERVATFYRQLPWSDKVKATTSNGSAVNYA